MIRKHKWRIVAGGEPLGEQWFFCEDSDDREIHVDPWEIK